MAKKITKKAEDTAKKEVETNVKYVGVVEPIKEDEVNVESVSTEVTSLQEEIETVNETVEQVENIETIQQEIKGEIEDTANEVINEVKSKIDETETNFTETVNVVTEKIAEEMSKKDEFLKNLEKESLVKNEDELKDMISKEIERIDTVIQEISQQNKTPLTTYYWNGVQYDF